MIGTAYAQNALILSKHSTSSTSKTRKETQTEEKTESVVKVAFKTISEIFAFILGAFSGIADRILEAGEVMEKAFARGATGLDIGKGKSSDK